MWAGAGGCRGWGWPGCGRCGSEGWLFLFSSRRRHTRWTGDWSSDVCSSDLAQRQGRLDEELRKLLWTPLLTVDEVGYIPFDAQAANLMFSLVSSRYERASLIVTSNKPFSAWGEIFGDEVVSAAMIYRLVHHAEILSLKGDSYRLRDRDLGGRPPAREPESA